jgi:hypothetical protein
METDAATRCELPPFPRTIPAALAGRNSSRYGCGSTEVLTRRTAALVVGGCVACVCRLAIEKETGVRMDQVDPKALAFVVAGYVQPRGQQNQQLDGSSPYVRMVRLRSGGSMRALGLLLADRG